MSLQISTTFANSLTAPTAVHKILGLSFTAPGVLYLEVGIFADLAKSQDGLTPRIEMRTFSMTSFDPAAAQNVHTQAYNYLKTLPAYAGATDV